ncbi:hypothetical protein BC332_08204 [Capsicum chinense]|nr:hypothetical protein BC332_08204 [Capsicum chinense]
MLSSFSSYTYSNPKKLPRTPKKGKDKSCDRDDLVSIVGPSFKNKNLIEALKGKGLSKKHKQSLCLVWFVHNILWARDVNNNISLSLIKLSEDLEAFNSYPWGAKHDVVINAINALTASVKELTSKRGLIPSKRILFPSAPLEIRAKRRRRVISRALLSGIQKSDITTPLSVCCTKQHTMSKEEHHEIKKVDVKKLLLNNIENMLFFLWNTENRKRRNHTQATIKIHDEQSRIP